MVTILFSKNNGSQILLNIYTCPGASLVAQLVKNPSARRKTWVRYLGWKEPLEKGKATLSVFWPGEFHGL